jgi:hypothetical protein
MSTNETSTWMATTRLDGAPCVYPLDDLKPHVVNGECWCRPFEDDGVIVHNAMDRREEYERGRMAS